MITQATPTTLLAILAVLILYAMNIARMAKQQKQPSPPLAAPALLLFAAFHAHYWMSPVKYTFPMLTTYIPAGIASLAFFFGASLMCSGAMYMCDGELCVNKSNSVYKLVRRLPVNFEGKSLCSVSWAAALLMLIMPFLSAIVAVIAIVASLVICLFTGQNPIRYAAEIMKMGAWPDTDVQLAANGWPKGLGIYLAVVAVVGGIIRGLYWLFTDSTSVWWLGMIGKFALVGVVCIIITALLSRFILQKMVVGEEKTDREFQYIQSQFSRGVYDDLGATFATFDLLGVFVQVFKKKFCPRIRYVCEEEETATS